MADKKPKAKEQDQAGKKSPVGFVMLAVAAMAGSFAVSYLAEPAPLDAPESCAAEEKPSAQSYAMVHKNLVYISLPEILTTIGSEPATRFLKMNISVATTKDGASTVEDNKLVIIDAFISYLRSVELTDFEDPGFYGHMREQLAHRSNIILGPQVSDSVLITEFLIR